MRILLSIFILCLFTKASANDEFELKFQLNNAMLIEKEKDYKNETITGRFSLWLLPNSKNLKLVFSDIIIENKAMKDFTLSNENIINIKKSEFLIQRDEKGKTIGLEIKTKDSILFKTKDFINFKSKDIKKEYCIISQILSYLVFEGIEKPEQKVICEKIKIVYRALLYKDTKNNSYSLPIEYVCFKNRPLEFISTHFYEEGKTRFISYSTKLKDYDKTLFFFETQTYVKHVAHNHHMDNGVVSSSEEIVNLRKIK